jgi:hypothetical protein
MNLQSLPIFSEREGWLVTADVLVANLDEHLPTYHYLQLVHNESS